MAKEEARGFSLLPTQKTLVLLTCAALISGCSNRIESSHGSSVACIASRDYIICAADSRNTNALNNRPENDTACKMIALGTDTLFVNTGTKTVTVKRGTSWDALETARKVFKQSPTKDTRTLLNAWSRDAYDWFRVQRRVDLETLTNYSKFKGPITIVTGGFLGFTKEGLPIVQAEDVNYDRDTHTVTQKPTFEFLSGVVQMPIFGAARDLVGEFFDGATQRAKQASLPVIAPRPIGRNVNLDVDTAKRAVQFAIDNTIGDEQGAVGGPIDVVILRKGSIQWTSRKASCFDQDVKTTKK